MKSLKSRIDERVTIQLIKVNNIIERIESNELNYKDAILEIEKEIEDFKLVQRALDESGEEHIITDKIIRIKMAIKFIRENEIRQAKYSIKNL